MTSFIFNFKAFILAYHKPIKIIFSTILLIVVIEITINFAFKDKEILRNIYKENLLDLNFLRGVEHSKNMIGYKSYAFFYKKPEILLVGDSSGLHGVKPLIVKSYIKNYNMINAACCANTNWNGYLAIAKHYLRRNKSIKYLLLHTSLYGFPARITQDYGNKFGIQLSNLYLSPWHFFHKIPSMYFRRRVVETIYYGTTGKSQQIY